MVEQIIQISPTKATTLANLHKLIAHLLYSIATIKGTEPKSDDHSVHEGN